MGTYLCGSLFTIRRGWRKALCQLFYLNVPFDDGRVIGSVQVGVKSEIDKSLFKKLAEKGPFSSTPETVMPEDVRRIDISVVTPVLLISWMWLYPESWV